jgi:hypothetical protein
MQQQVGAVEQAQLEQMVVLQEQDQVQDQVVQELLHLLQLALLQEQVVAVVELVVLEDQVVVEMVVDQDVMDRVTQVVEAEEPLQELVEKVVQA